MPAHFHEEDGQGKGEADPEAAQHIGKLGIGAGVSGYELRLQRHAADGTRAGADLANLEMHRTDVDCALGHVVEGCSFCREIALRVGLEFFPAPGAAEIISLVFIICVMLCRSRIDGHPTDEISRGLSGRFVLMLMLAAMVRMSRMLISLVRGHMLPLSFKALSVATPIPW